MLLWHDATIAEAPACPNFFAALATNTIAASHQVYAPHQAVHQLAPALFAATQAAVSSHYGNGTQSQPVLLQAACFPGCVQLLGTAYLVDGSCMGAVDGWGDTGDAARDPENLFQDHHLTHSLLGRVRESLTALPKSAWPGTQPVVASVGLSGASSATLQTPAIGIPGADAQDVPAVALAYMEPVCAVAGAATRMQLHLRLNNYSNTISSSRSSGSYTPLDTASSDSGQSSGAAHRRNACRLLVYGPGGVVVDQCHELEPCIRCVCMTLRTDTAEWTGQGGTVNMLATKGKHSLARMQHPWWSVHSLGIGHVSNKMACMSCCAVLHDRADCVHLGATFCKRLHRQGRH